MANEVSTSTSPTYDYSNIGSVGGEAAQSVNGEMINKIRAAEEKSRIAPITEDIDNIELESDKIDEIITKVTEFKDLVNYFDIYNDENVFNQFIFDAKGDSAVFDAVNMAGLEEGTTSINVSQLAQRDVYQSNTISDSENVSLLKDGTFSIAIGEKNAIDFDTTDLTYTELAQNINETEGLSASIEQVGDSSFRLVVKSTETGTSNGLTISGLDLGFDTRDKQFFSEVIDENDLIPGTITLDGIEFGLVEEVKDNRDGDKNGGDPISYTDLIAEISAHEDYSATLNSDNKIEITRVDDGKIVISDDNIGFSGDDINHNQTLKAQNLNATIDGVSYDTSSNSITTQGSLKITAVQVNEPDEFSTITISKDTSAVTIAAESLVTQYNSLKNFLEEEISDSESVIENKDTLRTIVSDIKSMLFSSYGADKPNFGSAVDDYGDIVKEHSNVTNNDKNVFIFGFSLDKSGDLALDKDTFNAIINGENDNYDFDDLKSVFTGSYENKGLGVQLNDYLDALDGYQGLISNYQTSLITKEEDLEKDKKDEIEALDAKYGIMAAQFTAYSGIIAQMESSFSGLKMMIEQSTVNR